MKVYTAGFPVQHIDEPAPANPVPAVDPLPSVADAMAAANARSTELLPSSTTSLKREPLKQTLRTDGPTLAEFVAAGYLAENYPPEGYAEREPA